MRAAFDEVVQSVEAHADRSRPLQLLLRDEPGVRGILEERRRRWQELLAPLVSRRLPRRRRVSGSDTRPVAVAGSAIVCLEAAQEAWAEHPGARFGTLLDEATGSVSPLT